MPALNSAGRVTGDGAHFSIGEYLELSNSQTETTPKTSVSPQSEHSNTVADLGGDGRPSDSTGDSARNLGQSGARSAIDANTTPDSDNHFPNPDIGGTGNQRRRWDESAQPASVRPSGAESVPGEWDVQAVGGESNDDETANNDGNGTSTRESGTIPANPRTERLHERAVLPNSEPRKATDTPGGTGSGEPDVPTVGFDSEVGDVDEETAARLKGSSGNQPRVAGSSHDSSGAHQVLRDVVSMELGSVNESQNISQSKIEADIVSILAVPVANFPRSGGDYSTVDVSRREQINETPRPTLPDGDPAVRAVADGGMVGAVGVVGTGGAAECSLGSTSPPLSSAHPNEKKAQVDWLKSLLPKLNAGWWDVAANGKGFIIKQRWREHGQQTQTYPRVSREHYTLLKEKDFERAKEIIEDRIYGHIDDCRGSDKPERRERARSAAKRLGIEH